MFPENAAQRSFQACLECRRSKLKCDGLQHVDFQCSRCTARDKVCIWPAPIPNAITFQSAQQQQQQQQQQYQQQQPLYQNPSIASTSEDPLLSNTFTQTGHHPQQTHPLSDQEIAATTQPTQKRQRIRRNTETSSGQSQFIDFPNSAPIDSLRSVALLSPEEAIIQHRSQGFNPSDYAHDNPEYSINEGENFDAIIGDNEDSNDVSDTDSALEHKQSMDEQIHALKERMGWTKERLHEASVERRNFFADAIAPEPSEIDKLDPIQSGILQAEDVERLFKLFYETINVQHCLLDERFDSWQNVQKSSKSLFITICAITATLDDQNPTSRHCYPILQKSMDFCTSLLISSNAKSTEVVKTLLLTFLFMSKPNFAREDRCWTLIDTAGRIASELGMGKRLRTVRSTLSGKLKDDHQLRSTERAWATAVLLQRSLGSLHGMVSVINLDVQWNQLDKWSEDERATAGDAQHCAYLNLRRIEFYTRSQLQKMEEHKFLSLESIRVSFNTLFQSWKQRYVQHDKLIGQYARKNILLVVGLHIQLLINVTALHTSKISSQPMYMVPDSLEDQCAKMSIEFCQFFLDNFQYRAHQLGRNIVSMVTWSVMIMLQLRYRDQRLLATSLAILLAGSATEHLRSNSFARFSGRWLLSLINDLAKASSERKAAALLRYKKFDYNTNYRFPGFANNNDDNNLDELQSNREDSEEANQTLHADEQISRNQSQSLSVDRETDANIHNAAEVHTDSTENILSSMSGHMTTDPFNETWLNSFLDSLVPPSLTPSNDPSGSTSTSGFNVGGEGNSGGQQESNQLSHESGTDFIS